MTRRSTDRDEADRVAGRARAIVQASQERNLSKKVSTALPAEIKLERTWLWWFGESKLTPSQQAGTIDRQQIAFDQYIKTHCEDATRKVGQLMSQYGRMTALTWNPASQFDVGKPAPLSS
jgi:hypothetical protein